MKLTPQIVLPLFLLLGTMDLMAQSITHAYEFPGQKFRETNEIIKDGEDVYILLGDVDNEILEFLPEGIVDSFDVPTLVYENQVLIRKSSMLLHFDPEEGIDDYTLINYNKIIESRINVNNSLLSFCRGIIQFGINDQIYYPHSFDTLNQIVNQEVPNAILIYDIEKDSLVFEHFYENEGNSIKAQGFASGDHIYYMTTLNDSEDLVLMGDTLRYERDELGRRFPNFLHKINYKTGEKEWSQNIGAGRELKLFADEDHNVLIDMRYSGQVTYNYEVVRLENHYGDDRVVMKIDPEGNYVDHVHVQNGPVQTTGKTMFNKDGSFQISGAVFYPTYVWIDDTDSIDFTDVILVPSPNEKFKGYVLTFDSNMNFNWHSRLEGGTRRFPYSFNRKEDGSYLTATECLGDAQLIIDESLFVGPTFSSPAGNNLKKVVAIHQYDENGKILGKPSFIGPNHRIHDLEELTENNYLALVEVSHHWEYEFLDSTLNGQNVAYLFLQYEGDIHDIQTTISEYVELEHVKAYPNPVSAGQTIHMDLNNVDRSDPTFTLVSINGQIQKMVGEKLGRRSYQLRIPDDLFPGIYILQVNQNGRIINKKIIIQ